MHPTDSVNKLNSALEPSAARHITIKMRESPNNPLLPPKCVLWKLPVGYRKSRNPPHKMEAGESKGGVNEVGSEPFPGCAVGGRDAFSLVGGKAGMVKAVEDVDGGLADSAGGEQVFNDMVAE